MYPMNVTKLSHQDGAKKSFFFVFFQNREFQFPLCEFSVTISKVLIFS